MIGIVVVSHSRALAQAAVELARQLVPPDATPSIVTAAGDADGGVGTDAVTISKAIITADTGDGVLVLIDLGSALLTAGLATEFLVPALRDRVVLSPAPLVEGLLTAVVSAAQGAPLDEVAAEARRALAAKLATFAPRVAEAAPLPAAPVPAASVPAPPEAPAADQAQAAPTDPAPETAPADSAGVAATLGPLLHVRRSRRPAAPARLTWRTTLDTTHGLHIRPSAKIVTALRDLDADVQLSNASTGRGPVPATSLSRVAALEVQQGQILEARITGPDAERARDVLADLAASAFGETTGAWSRPRQAVLTYDAPSRSAEAQASGQQIVVGPVRRRTSVPNLDGYHPRSPKQELARFTRAVDEVDDYLAALATTRPAGADILQAQQALVTDRELAHAVVGRITEGFSAVDAVMDHLTRSARAFDALTDPYLRERGQDVRSVRRLLLLSLMRRPLADDQPGEACVWLVDELDAATATRLDHRLCLGVITTQGGASGHGALTAEARGIPVLTGHPEAAAIDEGEVVAFDPVTRELWVDPGDELLDRLRRLNAERASLERAQRSRAHEPALTTAGRRIRVEANVSSLADALSGAAVGAEGSGVVRTEILFANRTTPPDAEEQADVYARIGQLLDGPISIRTWDAASDKHLPFLPPERGLNPALGVRGIRLMRRTEELFAEQLRGIALAARRTPVRLMFPMVTTPDEVRWGRSVLEGVLAETGPVDLPVGIMVEVPAAALRAADFAGVVDFASIGTNDLLQYTLASDRDNASLADLATVDSPALWDLIASTRRGLPDVPVAVCGNLASDPASTRRLIELGITELSVRPPVVAQVKHAVRQV